MATLEDFCHHIAKLTLTEADLAAAILWFVAQVDGHALDVSCGEIVSAIVDNRLRSSVNSSRLARNLAARADLVRGRTSGSFRIRASAEADYASRYKDFIRPKPLLVIDAVVSDGLPLRRQYLQSLRHQANSSFALGNYDCCAVMCRRLTESILIDALEKIGGASSIVDTNGSIRSFGDLIDLAKSRTILRLSRTAPAALDRVKTIGDAAAHHRHYITRDADILSLNPSLSHLLSELCSASGY